MDQLFVYSDFFQYQFSDIRCIIRRVRNMDQSTSGSYLCCCRFSPRWTCCWRCFPMWRRTTSVDLRCRLCRHVIGRLRSTRRFSCWHCQRCAHWRRWWSMITSVVTVALGCCWCWSGAVPTVWHDMTISGISWGTWSHSLLAPCILLYCLQHPSVHSPPDSPHPMHITLSQSSPSLSSSVTPSTFHSLTH